MRRANRLALVIVLTVMVAWLTVWFFKASTQPLMLQGRLEELRVVAATAPGTTERLLIVNREGPVDTPTAKAMVARGAVDVSKAITNARSRYGEVYCELRILLDSDDTYHGLPAGSLAVYRLDATTCEKLAEQLEPGRTIVFTTTPGTPPSIASIVRVDNTTTMGPGEA